MMPQFYHLELTSRCNKACPMCGRRKMERDHPELCDWGDMPFDLVQTLEKQIPMGAVVQFHNNGEPLLYPDLGQALSLFKGRIRSLNTNGILLYERAADLIGNLETIVVSVIEGDTYEQRAEQLAVVKRFMDAKGAEKPRMIFRLLGDVSPANYTGLGLIVTRTLHAPEASRNYRRTPTIPEIGICLDLLTHLAVDRHGNISMCVRLDPKGDLRIGKAPQDTLAACWNSPKRQSYLNRHLTGRRDQCPGCDRCHFWGVPTAG